MISSKLTVVVMQSTIYFRGDTKLNSCMNIDYVGKSIYSINTETLGFGLEHEIKFWGDG